MKKVIIIGFLIVLLSSCSNEQLKDAVDQCKGDPECYTIIDDVITEELESRGITGGSMTVGEMSSVLELYNKYHWDYNYIEMNMLDTIQMEKDGNFSTDELTGINNYFNSMNSLNNFKIQTLYDNQKQYLLQDDTRHIIYKLSKDVFIYEISTALSTNTYTFDLTFDSIRELNTTVKKKDIYEYIDNDALSSTVTKVTFENGEFIFIGLDRFSLCIINEESTIYIGLGNTCYPTKDLSIGITKLTNDEETYTNIEISFYTGNVNQFSTWLENDSNIISEISDSELSVIIQYIKLSYDNYDNTTLFDLCE